MVCEFSGLAAAIIKHTNPAGCAEQALLANAYRMALECDPVSAFGGVIGLNREVDEETASELAKLFVEAIAAPSYSAAALSILQAKKNLRLVRVTPADDPLVVKSISGGYLAQTADRATFDREKCEVKTRRIPTAEEWAAMEFGWKVVKHVKSNAIIYARPGQIAAVGAGQMSRVDSVNIASAMKSHLPLTVERWWPRMLSFRFRMDWSRRRSTARPRSFNQPGGSVKDAEVIDAADQLDLAMVFTRRPPFPALSGSRRKRLLHHRRLVE